MANLTAYSNGDGQGKGIAEIYTSAVQKTSPDDVSRIKEYSGLSVIVKGIERSEDAIRAITAGADGVYVSNHGVAN